LLALRLRDIERFGGDWRQAIDHVEKVHVPPFPAHKACSCPDAWLIPTYLCCGHVHHHRQVPMFDPAYEAKVLSQPVPSLAKTKPPRRDGAADSDGELGHFLLSVAYEEDVHGLFLSDQPRAAPPPPEEQLSVERLGLHIERFKVGSLSTHLAPISSLSSPYPILNALQGGCTRLWPRAIPPPPLRL
jgi:hypothetical protein